VKRLICQVAAQIDNLKNRYVICANEEIASMIDLCPTSWIKLGVSPSRSFAFLLSPFTIRMRFPNHDIASFMRD
jgi:hypothetical protein